MCQACFEHFTNIDSCKLQRPLEVGTVSIPTVQRRKPSPGWRVAQDHAARKSRKQGTVWFQRGLDLPAISFRNISPWGATTAYSTPVGPSQAMPLSKPPFPIMSVVSLTRGTPDFHSQTGSPRHPQMTPDHKGSGERKRSTCVKTTRNIYEVCTATVPDPVPGTGDPAREPGPAWWQSQTGREVTFSTKAKNKLTSDLAL